MPFPLPGDEDDQTNGLYAFSSHDAGNHSLVNSRHNCELPVRRPACGRADPEPRSAPHRGDARSVYSSSFDSWPTMLPKLRLPKPKNGPFAVILWFPYVTFCGSSHSFCVWNHKMAAWPPYGSFSNRPYYGSHSVLELLTFTLCISVPSRRKIVMHRLVAPNRALCNEAVLPTQSEPRGVELLRIE